MNNNKYFPYIPLVPLTNEILQDIVYSPRDITLNTERAAEQIKFLHPINGDDNLLDYIANIGVWYPFYSYLRNQYIGGISGFDLQFNKGANISNNPEHTVPNDGLLRNSYYNFNGGDYRRTGKITYYIRDLIIGNGTPYYKAKDDIIDLIFSIAVDENGKEYKYYAGSPYIFRDSILAADLPNILSFVGSGGTYKFWDKTLNMGGDVRVFTENQSIPNGSYLTYQTRFGIEFTYSDGTSPAVTYSAWLNVSTTIPTDFYTYNYFYIMRSTGACFAIYDENGSTLNWYVESVSLVLCYERVYSGAVPAKTYVLTNTSFALKAISSADETAFFVPEKGTGKGSCSWKTETFVEEF
jgi:hypothetical protein